MGIVCSGLCAAHCVLAPLILASAPVGLAALAGSEWTHRVLLIASVILALSVVPMAFLQHRRAAPGFLVAVGLSLLFAGVFVHEWELPLTLCGATAIVGGHLWNSISLRRALSRS